MFGSVETTSAGDRGGAEIPEAAVEFCASDNSGPAARASNSSLKWFLRQFLEDFMKLD
jgi:hypothetical protein